MALSGIQIYKLLPQTNCKECGFPTCLAFAMKLAAKQVELSPCPYVSDATPRQLAESAAPPIRLVTLQTDGHEVKVGNEVVLFRHEKTFYNRPGLMVRLRSDDPRVGRQGQAVHEYTVERVGLMLQLDGVALEQARRRGRLRRRRAGGGRRRRRAARAARRRPGRSARRRPRAAARKPLLGVATAANAAAMAAAAKEHGCALLVRGAGDLDSVAAVIEAAKGAGVEDLVLDPGASSPAASLALATQLRRLAIKKNRREVGFPLIAFAGAASVEEQARRRHAGGRQVRRRDRSRQRRPGAALHAADAAPERLHATRRSRSRSSPSFTRSAPSGRTARCSSRPTSRSPISRCRARSRAAGSRRICSSPTPTASRC